ncbi:Cyclin-T2 [Trichinella zimbabwensis]|uniref:Cyclin-T2 n=1 Tax=Trichinella zimbabwensis TaxID=268475 RepID=A0A0V1I999_9BILA|nr:Cyclin-T2 [Trichinella zimbabwensis]
MESLGQSQESSRWLFSDDSLAKCPSILAGFDQAKELAYRQQAANHIAEMGSKLSLSQLSLNTAIVYMHRFYVFHSFQRFPRFDVAAAALFLSAKVEECPRKLEYVVKVSYALQYRDAPSLETNSPRYAEEAQKIITFENILLQTLGFDINVVHPHAHVVRCCQLIKAPKDLAHSAYFFATDSLHWSTFCLRYRPAVVACICIHLACSWANWEIPPSKEGKPWYEYVDPNITMDTLQELAHEFAGIRERLPDKYRLRRFVRREGQVVAVQGGEAGSETSGMANSTELAQRSVETEPVNLNASTSSGHVTTAAGPSHIQPVLHSEQQQEQAGRGDVNHHLTDPVTHNDDDAATANLESKSSHHASQAHSVIDLKLYKERREREREANPTSALDNADSKAQRKSFIPYLTNAAKDQQSSGTAETKPSYTSTVKEIADHQKQPRQQLQQQQPLPQHAQDVDGMLGPVVMNSVAGNSRDAKNHKRHANMDDSALVKSKHPRNTVDSSVIRKSNGNDNVTPEAKFCV